MARRPPPRSSSAAEYLASRVRFGVKFGLGTIRALVRVLGHPERAYPTLLVAGTNGKGSVVAYAAAALSASGLRVGRYTSPHLVSVRERIAVGGTPISWKDLDRAVNRVREAAATLVRAGDILADPTYFEVLTAAAFDHFRTAEVEVAVLEVGMGGRLDATNVARPLVSAIVSIDRDHETYLGTTLASIAREKAGVLRRGRATVLGPLRQEARQAVVARARLKGARIVDAPRRVSVRDVRGAMDVRTRQHLYRAVHGFPGRHQRDNLLVAIRLLEEAKSAGVDVDLAAVSRGISAARWPGRLERIPGRPPLLLDGAHNPAGARALADHLRTLGPFVLLFGAMADKAVEEIAAALFPLASAVVLTRPPVSRAATPAEIARRAGPLANRARLEGDPRRALALAKRLAGRRPVVVAGSLYLVGEVMKALGRTPSG
jgi:dihydrofolate synthase/folylpolyglutamate synthase